MLFLFFVFCCTINGNPLKLRWLEAENGDEFTDSWHQHHALVRQSYFSNLTSDLHRRRMVTGKLNARLGGLMVEVSIAGEPFPVIVNAKSSDFWISGKDASAPNDSSDLHAQRKKIDPSSPALTDSGMRVRMWYGGKDVSVSVYRGEIGFASKSRPNQPFGVSTLQRADIGIASGVLGIGPFSGECTICKDTHGTPVIRSLGFQQINLYVPESSSEDGELSFGNPNHIRYTGAFKWEPSDSAKLWSFKLSSVYVSGHPETEASLSVVIDLRAIGISLPKAIADVLANNVGATETSHKDTYKIDCADKHTGKPLFIQSASGHTYTVPPAAYVVPMDDNTCRFAVVANTEENETNILGKSFLQNLYTRFDNKEGRIGFANAVHMCCIPLDDGCCAPDCECCQGIELGSCHK